MQLAEFNAVCPFEIGDVVAVQGKGQATITDIACTHFVKSGKILFRYEFNNSGKYFTVEKLETEGGVGNEA